MHDNLSSHRLPFGCAVEVFDEIIERRNGGELEVATDSRAQVLGRKYVVIFCGRSGKQVASV